MRELRRGGYDPTFERVDTPESFSDALTGQPWDVIIADYAMPRFSGLDALRMLQETELDLPFILVSGTIGEEVAVEAMRAGAHDYVMKSNLARLVPAVRRELREAETRRARKRAEERLRLLSSATEQSTEGIAVVDLEGNILFTNRAFAAMHGYAPGKLIGKHLSIFHTPEQMPSVEKANRQIRETGEFSGEIWHVRRDGTIFPTLMHNSLLRDEAGNQIGMIGTIRDITERKRAEQALRTRERFLECLSGVAQQLLSVIDLPKALPQVLRSLGETAAVSRVHLFENHLGSEGELTASLRYEWCAPGIEPQVDSPNLQNYPYADGGLARWVETLARGGVITRSVTDFPASERPALEAQGIRSILIIPLFVSGNWYGFISFDVCDLPREWQQVEIDLLRTAASAISNVIEREQAIRREQALARAAATLTSTLDFDQVLDHILEQVSRVVPNDAANVMLIEDDRAHIVRWRGYERFGVEEFVSSAFLHVPEAPNLQQMWKSQEPLVISDTAAYPGWMDIPEQRWLRSYAAAPIIVRGQVLGFLNVDSAIPGFFSQSHAAILRTFADHTAAAIENARLFEKVSRRMAELDAVRRASLSLTSSLELQPVLEAILEHILRLVSADGAHVFFYDGERLTFGAALWAKEIQRKPFSEPRQKGLTYTVARSGERIVVSDMREHPLFQGQSWDDAIVGLPLRVGGQVVGVMNVSFNGPHAFSKDELRVLGLLADQAAIAIRNARLHQETRRQARKLAALIEIGHDVSATLDLPTVLERIATHAQDLLEADDSEVYLLQENGRTLRAIVALGDYADEIKAATLRLGEGVVGHVAQSGEAEIVNHVESDPRSVQISDTPEEPGALMCAPLISKDEVMGVMSLARAGEHDPFDRTDLDFLTGLARQASIAIENARLFATEQQYAVELTRALEQQQEAARLRNEFIQNVSHELRTPLALIRGYAELLDDGELGSLRPDQHEPVAVIARRTRMLTRLMENFTAILGAEGQDSQREPVDLVEMARDLLTDFREAAEQKGIALVSQIASDLPLVLGDPLHLRRVMDNLVGNALKFTPRGGSITLRLTQADKDLVLEVADTGIGIPEEQLEQVFERFYQVDGSMSRRYGGVGLGLALVKEIIKAHGGGVSVSSRVGQGSTFTVTLPIHT
ncbi:MAG: hypothetical protein DRJ03_07605 [Chloroflexi bacterium]|nr:MAG: hypothetical protein DRJ03_07605 [Chloroflexota bacterium]